MSDLLPFEAFFNEDDDAPRERTCSLCGNLQQDDGTHPYNGEGDDQRCPYARKEPDFVDEGQHDPMKYCDSECQNNHLEDLSRGIGSHHTFHPSEPADDRETKPHRFFDNVPVRRFDTSNTQNPHEAPKQRQDSAYEYRDPSADLRCHYCRKSLVDTDSLRPRRHGMNQQPLPFEQFHQAALVKKAHDSGDGETIYHCPFCGSGQVLARSDKTIECQFCHTCFTVQVQPQYPAFPQTVNGVPVQVPGMPGAVTPMPGGDPMDPMADPMAEGGFPPEEGEEEAPAEDDEEDGGNPFAKGSALRTSTGALLAPDAYVAHLALRHAADRDVALAAVRARRA